MTATAAELLPGAGRTPAPTPPTALRRHDRVWLAAGWRAHAPAAPADPRLDAWIAAGRALVVRRREPTDDDAALALGVALPLADGRLRLGLVVDRAAVARRAPPLALAEIVPADPAQRAALLDLVARGAACDTAFAVYGSFAWQAISGEPCVTPSSDIDLLWDARDLGQVERVIATLLRWEYDRGMRADGEARFPDGADIAWRELAGGAARVLVKRGDRVALEASPLRR